MSVLDRILPCLFFFSLPAWAGSSVPGICNFREVDAHVYRGGQPTGEGLKYLARIGVKTIVDLRGAGKRSSEEARAVTALGMHYVSVPMSGLTPPTEAQISRVLALLEDSGAGPVFVHCRRGADRTGAVVAAYRIDFDRWSNARALREAMSDGMSFFQLPRQRYIRTFRPRTTEAQSDSKAVEATTTPAASATAVLSPAAGR